MAVTNIWQVLNLRSTPFFQDALEPANTLGHPLSLFVGRQREATTILSEIGGSLHSRIAIQGAPGVGKTTLVNYVKAELAADGYIADANPIRVVSAATAEHLLLDILTSVHDALAARDETLANLEAMRNVRQLLDVERSRTFNLNLGLPHFASVGAGSGQHRHTGPGALSVQPHRLLRELREIAVKRLQTPGVLIHLDNIENASEADQQKAAQMIRDLRDTALMLEGFHFLVVGTDDAIRAVVAAQEQLRSVFHNPGSLAPLTERELDDLLEARYEHLRLDPTRPWIAPVGPGAVHSIYRLFRGNVRGTLHALNEAAKVLVGHGAQPTDPMTEETMTPVLAVIYAQRMSADLTSSELAFVRNMVAVKLHTGFTQADVVKALDTTQKNASEMFSALRRKGYLIDGETVRGPRGRGRPAQSYHLTAPPRIAFELTAS
ncbi:MAG TPA: ATP-binding protein [Longimicrobium sp.]|nr:ATP-binding protein [Longimicrobium sp.]